MRSILLLTVVVAGPVIGDTELPRDADARVDLTGRAGSFLLKYAVQKR
jgi:hypothetical protein